jgi:hypothetical protein
MNPWVVIDQVIVPGDGGEMKLLQRARNSRPLASYLVG